MSRPFFITALRSEAFAVRLGAPSARVFHVGLGGRKARLARAEIERRLNGRRPVLFGFSGGLHPGLRPGDLVVATRLIQVGDEEQFPLQYAGQIAALLSSSGVTVKAAPIATSPRLVKGREAREKIAATGAVAVDMESCFLAPLAAVGLVVVRVILDVPGREFWSPATVPAALKASAALARASRLLWSSAEQLQSVGSTDNARSGAS